MNTSNKLNHGQLPVKAKCWCSIIFLNLNIIQYTFKLRAKHSRS